MPARFEHIGVIGAMAGEIDELRRRLAIESVTEHAGRTFHHGALGAQRITLVQSRIGKVAATITALSLIRDHAVDAIVFTGIAGALDDRLAIGDVVVASSTVQHDLQGPTEMFARSEIPLLGIIQLATDPALADAAVRAAGDYVTAGLDELRSGGLLDDLGIVRPTVHVGQIATGDEFIEGDLRRVVRERGPVALCVDMEAAAVAQVCHELGGVPLCVIRAISDMAGDTASEDFPKFLDRLAANYSAEILERMFTS